MLTNKTNRSRMTVAVAALGAMLMFAAPVLATTQPIAVQKVVVSGAIVQVTVKNTSSAPASGTVAVQAVVGDTPIWSLVPVTLSGGQCASVSAAFTGSVSKVLSVGIQDDPTPY